MKIVMDVSGAIEILLQKESFSLFSTKLIDSTLILAPDLYVSELTNVLWKYYRSNIFSKDKCIQYIDAGITYIDKFIDSKELWQEAFSEGINNNHSMYDMFYFVTARRNNAMLLTKDSVLSRICQENKIQICC